MNPFEENFNPEKIPSEAQEQQMSPEQRRAKLDELENYRRELGERLKKMKESGGTGSQVIKKINDIEEKIKFLSQE